MDLLDRLLGHDAWTTRQLLLRGLELSDEQLDHDFDLSHRTVRATFLHIIWNMEAWTDGLDERWRDVSGDPATEKSYGGAIAHVITHSMHHQAQLIHMMGKLGAKGLPEGDVLSWEQRAVRS